MGDHNICSIIERVHDVEIQHLLRGKIRTFKGNPLYPYHSPMLRDIIVRPVTFRLHVFVSISEQKMPISECKMLL